MAAQVADAGRQAIPVLYEDKITWCVPPNLTIYGSQGWYDGKWRCYQDIGLHGTEQDRTMYTNNKLLKHLIVI